MQKRQETENAGLLQVQPTQGPGTPSEMQLAFPASTPHPTALQVNPTSGTYTTA